MRVRIYLTGRLTLVADGNLVFDETRLGGRTLEKVPLREIRSLNDVYAIDAAAREVAAALIDE